MASGKDPQWESKLWSYLSKGDGEHCPLHDHCQGDAEGGQCLDDTENNISQIIAFIDDDFPLSKLAMAKPSFVSCPKVRSIFQLAEKLAQKYLDIGNIHSPPIPAALIGLFDEQHAIEIREVPLKAYHGAIWHMKDKWIIYLNENDTPARKRFVLFHEAFHILAHAKTTPVFRKIGVRRGSFNELLADHFAGCILMPRELVKEKWAEYRDIDKMAEIFEIPKSLVWLGLKGMGLL